MKVLLVEDHPAVGRISCDLLRDVYGHQVEYAADGLTAVRTASTFLPDVVLLDLNLPDMTGYELARRLRLNPQLQPTILVTLTGFGTVISPEEAEAAGIDAQFRKPMNFELLPTIKRCRPTH